MARNFDQIYNTTRIRNDRGYVDLHALDSAKQWALATNNFRTPVFTRNPFYLTKQPYHTQYDLQGIDEGQGPGMNVDNDSRLRFAETSFKPCSNLYWFRDIHIMPKTNQLVDEFAQNAFLVHTSYAPEIQKRFNPEFDSYGVNTRNYHRLSDEFYRALVHKSNKYRKKSKYYR